MDDLDVVVPLPGKTVEGIEVRPLVVRQISPFTKVLKRLPDDVFAKLQVGDVQMLDIMEHCDLFAEAVAIATSNEVKKIGDMQPDQLINLVGAVLEVNLDFFVRKLGPALNELLAAAMRMSANVGPTSSSASSSTGTGGPTSSITP